MSHAEAEEEAAVFFFKTLTIYDMCPTISVKTTVLTGQQGSSNTPVNVWGIFQGTCAMNVGLAKQGQTVINQSKL